MQVYIRILIAVFGNKLKKKNNLYLMYIGSSKQKKQNNKKSQSKTTTVFKEKLQLFTLCFTYSGILFVLIKDYLIHGTIYATNETSKE